MDWATWNWVDWLFVIVLLYGGAMGAVRGLSHELATLIGMVVAVIVTRLFYWRVSDWICNRWGWNPEITRLVAVVALVLLSLYGMRAIRIGLGTMITFSFKGWVERIGGLLTGAIRQGFIFLLILLAAYFVDIPWLQRAVREKSKVGNTFLPHLVVEYNAFADITELPKALVPVGVEQPYAIMPPVAEPVVDGEPQQWTPE